MSNIIEEYTDIHDYEIASFEVDIQNQKLKILAGHKGNKISITFTNLLAHQFDHVTYSNIIFDITQVTVDYFVDNYKDMLEESLQYCFPVYNKNLEELRAYLKLEGQKIFELCASLGLSGFIIAKEISMERIS